VSGGTIALSTVNVELDGSVAEGVWPSPPMADRPCRARSRPTRLDLTPFTTIRLLTNNDRDWNRVPLVIAA
jgi:hypothetical protein